MISTNSRIAQAARDYAPHCPDLAAGIASFAESLTSSHSLTSRRFSVWTLLKDHVDKPFATLELASIERRLLAGFKPSQAWKEPGEIAKSELARNPAVAHFALLPTNARSPVTRALQSMERWIHCLRLAVHACHERGTDASPTAATTASALDLTREVIDALKRLGPRQQRIGHERSREKGSSEFCELCWRLSAMAEAHQKGNDSDDYRSTRFCVVHDPRAPKSRYRTDLRYKAAFQHELEAVTNFADSAYAFELPGLPHPDEAMLRRLAYDRVHSGIRSPAAKNTLSLKERVWILHQTGLNQASIARSLGISRQAVSKTMIHLRIIWKQHMVRLGDYLQT